MTVTAQVEVLLDALQEAAKTSWERERSLQKTGERLGVSRGVARFIARGQWEHVSWETVRHVHLHVFGSDPGEIVQALGCPSCGEVHGAGDCHNRPVSAVVFLGPGEAITLLPEPARPKRLRRRAMLQVQPETRERLRAQLRPGESFDAAILRLCEAAS